MAINAADLEILLDAQADVKSMAQLLPPSVRDTAPASVIGALLTVELEHCEAILILLMTGEHNASAQALIRPAVECVLRLVWVAEDRNRAVAVTDNKMPFPSISVLMKRISKQHSPKTQGLDASLKHVHGLTHTGLELLSQYFAGRSSVPLEELGVRAVSFLCVLLAFSAAAQFCLFSGRMQEASQLTPIAEQKILLGFVRLGTDAAKEALRLAQKKP